MAWGWLALAIVFEVGWAICMKLSAGFTKLVPAALTAIFYILSLVFLTLATKKADVGVAYAIWAGTGTALIALIGIVFLGEPLKAMKLVSIGLIIAGVVGLNLYEGGHE